MAMPQSHGWTLEMVHALPDDGNRYELIDGELFVTPAPTGEHQNAAAMLWHRLHPFAKSLGLQVLFAPFSVRIRGPGEVQPDLVAFPRRRGERIPALVNISDLVLAVEILSPGTKRADRQVKRRLYQTCGVAEYWIVDLNTRVIERWLPNDEQPEMAAGEMVWRPVVDAEALRMDVVEYFREAFD